MIAIVDYKAGNLTSVPRALDILGHRCEITDRAERIVAADRVILPGVGAAGATMENLHGSDSSRFFATTSPAPASRFSASVSGSRS